MITLVYKLRLCCASIFTITTVVNNVPRNIIATRSLRIVMQFKKSLGIQNVSFYSPTGNYHLYQPSLSDKGFQIWHDKGICNTGDLLYWCHFCQLWAIIQKILLMFTFFVIYKLGTLYFKKKIANFPSIPSSSCRDSLLGVNILNKQSFTDLR